MTEQTDPAATPDDASEVVFEQSHNPYGSPPGSGITMPPYYQPTPSVKNKTNYFPQSEPLGPDEMRIIFMGSQPWPPRQSQAGTCIMVELGNGKRFFFDFGPGCLRNIIANQVPVPEITDIFITHLHLDHYADIPYLWQFRTVQRALEAAQNHRPVGAYARIGHESNGRTHAEDGPVDVRAGCRHADGRRVPDRRH